MSKVFDELTCSHVPCAPRDSSFVPRRVHPKSFSTEFSLVDGGRFSWVFKSTLTNQEVAVKVLKKTENSDFQKELDVLKHLGSHPNVITMVAICDNVDSAGIVNAACLDQGIVLPWHSGGSLRDFIKRNPELIYDDKCLRNLLLGICRGVEALHKQKVVHRDIACRNFLVSADGRIVLSDFGLSRRLEKDDTSVDEPEKNYQYLYYDGGGVLPFRSVAPESLSSLKFTMRSDIWSLGVLAIDLATNCQSTPFGHIRNNVELGIAFATNPSLPTDALPIDCPVILRCFVEKCCNMTPKLRPPIEKLVELAWTPIQDLRTMVSGSIPEAPSQDESKEAHVRKDAVGYEYSDVPSSVGSDPQGSTEHVGAHLDEEEAKVPEKCESPNLGFHTFLHLRKVLREHKFDDSLFDLLTDEDMIELHSHLGNALTLKLHIFRLQEKYGKPRGNEVPIRKSKGSTDGAQHVEKSPRSSEADAYPILLLGASQTGKSTLFTYIRELYGEKICRLDHKPHIYSNVVGWMSALIKQATDQDFLRRNPDCKMDDGCRQAASLISSERVQDGIEFDSAIENALKKLWADGGIRTCFKNHRAQITEPGIDSASYFFNKLVIIARDDYVPSFRDCMKMRIRTTGVVATKIVFKGFNMHIFDVGGTRNERKKWIHVYPEGKWSVFFVASLSEYDEVLLEDQSVNRMAESLQLFEDIVHRDWGSEVSFTLFLTKEELFKSKIKRVPLTVCFPDYKGPNEYSSALEFIKQKFLQCIGENKTVVHVRVTDLLDSTLIDISVGVTLMHIITSRAPLTLKQQRSTMQ